MDCPLYLRSINTGNVNSYNVTNSYNSITNVNKVPADGNPEIMRWLSPLDPGRRHQDVRTDRLDGAGNWLLETSEFREWRGGEGGVDKAVLFCYGNPGVGKTYLSSLVIDNLCDGPCEADIAIAMFYCDFRDQQQQTATDIIGAILKQLVVRGEVLENVQGVFEKARKEVGGRGLRLPDMVQMLKQAISTLPQVFICIDALDECLPKYLVELLGSLKDILEGLPSVRIFVTGRPQVETEISRYFATSVIVPISPKAHDIKGYLEKKLELDTEPDAMSDALRADILRMIPEKISVFLLVSLHIDAILAEVTIFERRQKLNEMAAGSHLEGAYATTLARMKAQKGSRSRLGIEALMWVSNSERPLHTSELCHALGVKIGSPDLNVENIPTIRTLLGCSLGLITVDASSSTARLVHFSLQEYISSSPGLFQSPHSMIAEVCLTYLNFQCVRKLSPTASSPLSTVPLVRYASRYWGRHMGREKAKRVNTLSLGLLVEFEQHIASHLLLLSYYEDICDTRWWELGFDGRDDPKGFTGLHGAAFLGAVDIVAALLAVKEWDINAADTTGKTALGWAAVRGHEGVVGLLLEREDISPNTTGTGYCQAPLLLATGGGHEGVAKLLLEREDIDPNSADANNGLTPLILAAMNGYEGIVKSLLEREDISPNTAEKYGETPLLSAAAGGHEGIVKLLLEREDINPNAADSMVGQTPLEAASEGGHEGVVKLLLERGDINPNTGARFGRTPLMSATRGGYVRIVELLLELGDINPNTRDTFGQTALVLATRGRHEGIVEMLLQREDANPNTIDPCHGQTLLSAAAMNGYEGIVKLLLGREDIDPDAADTEYCRTPLLWAADCGHEGVVELLLGRGDVNTDTSDLNGKTAFELAASRGHKKVMELLSPPEPSLLIPTCDPLYLSYLPRWSSRSIP